MQRHTLARKRKVAKFTRLLILQQMKGKEVAFPLLTIGFTPAEWMLLPPAHLFHLVNVYREIKPELPLHSWTVCSRFGACRQTGMNALESPFHVQSNLLVTTLQDLKDNKSGKHKQKQVVGVHFPRQHVEMVLQESQQGPSTRRLSGTVGTGRWCDTQHH